MELSTFANLARLIGPDYSFYAVIARGTDGKSEPHKNVEEMAAAYIQEIISVEPSGPYFLVGECLSAPVAYETARQLRLQGKQIGLLALLGASGRVPGFLGIWDPGLELAYVITGTTDHRIHPAFPRHGNRNT